MIEGEQLAGTAGKTEGPVSAAAAEAAGVDGRTDVRFAEDVEAGADCGAGAEARAGAELTFTIEEKP